MKKLRVRIGATGLAGVLAAGSIVGAFALQSDSLGQTPAQAPVATTIEDEPILYAGGYGLFPTH